VAQKPEASFLTFEEKISGASCIQLMKENFDLCKDKITALKTFQTAR